MEDSYMQLTQTDRKILNSYAKSLDILGLYLGPAYEIVLHSLENLNHSVIKIINGHYTGRKEGSPITDLALKMLNELNQNPDHIVKPYFNKGSSGSYLHSCTIPIIGEHNRIIGLLCMNFHMEVSLSTIFSNLIPGEAITNTISSPETFTDNIDDLIFTALEETKEIVYNDPTISSPNKNKEIVQILYQKGIFNLKDSVVKVAEQMGISKNTVYMHIRNFKNKN